MDPPERLLGFSLLPGEGAWQNPTYSFFGEAKSSLEDAPAEASLAVTVSRERFSALWYRGQARASGTNLKCLPGLPWEGEKSVSVCVGSCCCQLLQLALALAPLHRAMLQEGSFQAGSGMLAEAFKTDATLEFGGVSKSSSKNRLCLAED